MFQGNNFSDINRSFCFTLVLIFLFYKEQNSTILKEPLSDTFRFNSALTIIYEKRIVLQFVSGFHSIYVGILVCSIV